MPRDLAGEFKRGRGMDLFLVPEHLHTFTRLLDPFDKNLYDVSVVNQWMRAASDRPATWFHDWTFHWNVESKAMEYPGARWTC